MQVSVQGFKQKLKILFGLAHPPQISGHPAAFFLSTGIVTGLTPLWIMFDGTVSALELSCAEETGAIEVTLTLTLLPSVSARDSLPGVEKSSHHLAAEFFSQSSRQW